MTVKILTYGGIIQSIVVPDRHGHLANVALGFDNLADYVAKSPYFGCITGRYANRIALGQFTLDGERLSAADQQRPEQPARRHRRLRQAHLGHDAVQARLQVGLVMTFTSPDGDQGYPGTLDTQVTYTLTKHNGSGWTTRRRPTSRRSST